jgi:hypothetical protein
MSNLGRLTVIVGMAMELDQVLGLACIRKEVFHEYEKWGGGVRAEKTVYLK